MRELVLNPASLLAPSRNAALEWLKEMANGVAILVDAKVAAGALRMSEPIHEIRCLDTWSLADAYAELRQHGAREEYLLLLRLSTKVPLWVGLEQDIKDRFLLCEAVGCDTKEMAQKDGESLVLCAVIDGISVGFPSEQIWESSQLTVRFNELLPDGSIVEVSATVDNLTQANHAKLICENYARRFENAQALWQGRSAAFPNLLFGLDVEAHLTNLGNSYLERISRQLAILNKSANEWQLAGGPAERHLPSGARTEGQSVNADPRLRNERMYKSHRNETEYYEWHINFAKGSRIHFRIINETREIEIGYLGPHLRTARF